SAAVVIVLLIGIAFQSTQSIKIVGIGESVVGSDGLRLSTSVNATEIKIGERVNISVSVVNNRPASNVVPAQMVFGQDDQWPFFGIPVSTWPECTREFPALSWPLP